jgi:spermidine synthase
MHSILKKKQLYLWVIATFSVALIILFAFKSSVENRKVIYEGENEFGKVWAVEVKNLRCITFDLSDDVWQSCMDLNNVDYLSFLYLKAIMGALLISNHPPENILLIGLGGGSLAKAFSQAVPKAKIDIVEINPLIVDIAERYFDFKDGNNINLIIGDGSEFILNSQANKYDIIVLDAFAKDYIPPAFRTNELVEKIKSITKDNGVIAVNTFKDSSFYHLESRLYKNVFGQYKEIILTANRIIFVKKGAFLPASMIKANAARWHSRLTKFNISSDWLAEQMKNW